MIVKLHDIEESIVARGTMDGSKYKRPEDADLEFESPIEFELVVSKMGSDVRVEGPVKCTLRLSCDRCLESFLFPVNGRVDIELAPKSDEPKLPEMELTGEETSLYYYEGDELDLDPYIYEEVMLAIPIKALCNEFCKGICPVCGKNQNTETCRCDTSKSMVLGEKLQKFLKKG
ncbi:MAG TPA: DUF177 domain-containing protein [Syntrophorhabdales bacterium]|nr:DUF177 domain-containing protein [Syntrophorhabdales bacterium]